MYSDLKITKSLGGRHCGDVVMYELLSLTQRDSNLTDRSSDWLQPVYEYLKQKDQQVSQGFLRTVILERRLFFERVKSLSFKYFFRLALVFLSNGSVLST